MSALEIATTANTGTANFFAPSSKAQPTVKRSTSPPTSLKSKISSLLRRSPSPPHSSTLSPPPYSASPSVPPPTTFKPKRDESKNINFFLLASGHDIPA